MRRSLLLAVCLFLLSSASRSYVLTGARWPEASATIHPMLVLLGKDRSPSGGRWIDAFREAAQEWNDKTAFDFEIDTARPSHPCAGILSKYPEDDHQNGAAFTSVICTADPWGNSLITGFGAGILGLTMVYGEFSDTRTITETDIFFNEQEAWDIYDGPERQAFDFRRVALHELGHALGLDHELRKTAIMEPLVGDLYHLQQDDIAGVAALYGSSAPDSSPPIVLAVEEPAENGIESGISTFRGWVVSRHELASLSVYLDGKYKGELQHEASRKDVARANPGYPDPEHSGFAVAFAYGGLSAGSHRIRLVARDVMGNALERTVNFRVVRFATGYLKDDSRVSVNSARLSGKGNEILIDGMEHDGGLYQLRLRWNRGSQSFAPVEITPLK